MPDEADRPDGTRPPNTLGTVGLIEHSIVLLLVVGLLLGVRAVLRPFTTAILFGATLAIAAWPLRQAMIGWGLGRGLAATLLLLLSVVVVALPVLVMAPVLTDQLGQGIERVQTYFAATPAAAGVARRRAAGRQPAGADLGRMVHRRAVT